MNKQIFDGLLAAAFLLVVVGCTCRGLQPDSFEPSGSQIEVNFNAPSAPVSNSSEAPISGGVLNSKAVSLPKPVYPAAAKAVNAKGAVNVQVMVDETGSVTSAEAVSGHPLLRAAAVSAARAAKFNPTTLSNRPRKVTGVLVYNFQPE